MLLNGFLNSSWGNWLKIVSVEVIPPQVAQMKMCTKFAKESVKTTKVPF